VLGLLLATALAGGAIVALDQARRAQQEAERAVAARDFLIGILEAADPTLEYGHDPTASELLRRAARQIDDILEGQPGLRIELLRTIGRTQLERGLIDDAVSTLDRAVEGLGTQPTHPDRSEVLASRGMAAYEQGRYEQAIAFLERARTVPGAPDLTSQAGRQIAIQLADMQVIGERPESALALIDEVLAARPSPDERAAALRVKGGALELTDQLAAAERTLSEAWSLQNTSDPRHVNLAKIENDLGIVYWRMKDMARAAEQFEAAWRHKQAIYGRDHPQTLASLGNLAGVQSARRNYPAAEGAYRESLAGLHRVHGDSPHPDIAYTHAMLALNAYWQDDVDTARRRIDAALAHRERVTESDHTSLAWIDSLAALIAHETGETIDATSLGKDADRCLDWSRETRLGRRLCLAWWSITDACPTGTDPEVPDLDADAPIRWRNAWREIRSRCPMSPG
jgi:serine/threonine-protein kinase